MHAVFMCLLVNVLKLNLSVLVCTTEGTKLYVLMTLMYKLTRAQMHFKKHNSNSTENTVFLCGRL